MNKNNLYQTDVLYIMALAELKDGLSDLGKWSVYNDDLITDEVNRIVDHVKALEQKVKEAKQQ